MIQRCRDRKVCVHSVKHASLSAAGTDSMCSAIQCSATLACLKYKHMNTRVVLARE
jgi:hypothetical protein